MDKKVTYRLGKILCILMLVVVFLLPAVQRNLNLFEYQPLKGWHAQLGKPALTSKAWFSGDFQKNFDAYAADSFGFTPPLVRAINQLDFNLLNTANAQYVTVGKDNYLYETAYIDAVMGLDFVGRKAIEKKCFQLAEIQKKLNQKGIQLLVIMAPGKGSYFPEHIPDFYQSYQKDSTNYDQYINLLEKNKVAFLDFNKWFRTMKDTTTYHLFPQTGIHWSTYGMAVAGDSIMKYLSKTLKKQLPTYHITFGDLTTETRKSDSDVEDGMNLMHTLPHLPMMYPKIAFETSGTEKIKTAVIADSYFWGLYDHGFSSQATEGEFWYYFNEIYPQNIKADDLKLNQAILDKDVIIIMATDATLPKFGWGFIEQAFEEVID